MQYLSVEASCLHLLKPNLLRMKKILSLIAVILFGAAAYAQAGPKIEFRADTVDYGTVKKGSDDGKRFFVFTNTGDAPLVISEVKSTCGCTVPSWPKEPIAPGESGKIEVKYNMAPGPIRKTITVHSNAVNYPDGIVPLKLKGTVE